MAKISRRTLVGEPRKLERSSQADSGGSIPSCGPNMVFNFTGYNAPRNHGLDMDAFHDFGKQIEAERRPNADDEE